MIQTLINFIEEFVNPGEILVLSVDGVIKTTVWSPYKRYVLPEGYESYVVDACDWGNIVYKGPAGTAHYASARFIEIKEPEE